MSQTYSEKMSKIMGHCRLEHSKFTEFSNKGYIFVLHRWVIHGKNGFLTYIDYKIVIQGPD